MIRSIRFCDSEMHLMDGATGHNVEAQRLLHERRYTCARFSTATCQDKSSEKQGHYCPVLEEESGRRQGNMMPVY